MESRTWLWIALGGLAAALLAGGAVMTAESLIARFEGFSSTPYQDAGGRWTIGYGHLIVPSDPYYPYGSVKSITLEQGAQLLSQDLQAARQCVAEAVRVPLNGDQTDALVSFVYNVGCGAFRSSHLLAYLNAGDYPAAAAQFSQWVHVNGIVNAGLVTRRNQEAALFTGTATA